MIASGEVQVPLAGERLTKARPDGEMTPPVNFPQGTGQLVRSSDDGTYSLFAGRDRLVLRGADGIDRRLKLSQHDLSFACAFTLGGRRLAVGGYENVLVVSCTNGKIVTKFPNPAPGTSIKAVRFGRNPNRLLVATYGGYWDYDISGRPSIVHQGRGLLLDWREDLGLIVVGKPMAETSVCKYPGGEPIVSFPAVSVVGADFDSALLIDGSHLLVSVLGKEIRLYTFG